MLILYPITLLNSNLSFNRILELSMQMTILSPNKDSFTSTIITTIISTPIH